MPIQVKITSETKEKGTFRAAGVVTGPDGAELGKAVVYVAQQEGDAPRLVLPDGTKSTIQEHVVTEYKGYSFDGMQACLKLAKDAELTFTDLVFAI